MLEKQQFALKLISAATVIISTAFSPTTSYALSSAPLAQGGEPQERESTPPESPKEATQDPCKRDPNAVGCGDSGTNISTSDPRQECPEVFRRYEELEKETGNPQPWRGCSANHPHAQDFDEVSVFRERHEGGTEVYGIAWTRHREPFYLGLNLQRMDSPRLTYLEPDQNHRLESLYGVVGVSYQAPVSPYVEAGWNVADLVGALMYQWFMPPNDEVDCTTEYCPTVDAYFSIGIQNQPKRNMPLLRGYAKWYWVGPNQRTVYVPVVGVSLGWGF